MKEIKQTGSKGKGVFAEKSFDIGNLVLVGEIAKELKENSVHASQIALNRFILHDPTYCNLNHSCDPNCGIQLNASGAHNLIAKKPIKKGEEITFDYAMENYTIDHFPTDCLCGSISCRGKITGWKNLSETKKEEYRSWASPYLFEIDALKHDELFEK